MRPMTKNPALLSNQAPATFNNPILPGFYPDPSLCAVGDDFYLVTSTFAYFPGIPVFHSRDLVHWEQIDHVLTRPSQLRLDDCGHSQGIFAPTIRYHQGTFYVIVTNVSDKGNFVVTATNPAGPWSDPHWLEAPGIDPSLFFDDDGRAWYTGTRPVPEGPAYFGNWEVYLQELDLASMKLTGPAKGLWRGALREVVWPEGPHLYHIGEWYYLLIAEAGTGHEHAVSIARSKTIDGPYEGCKRNPILTNRHLGNHWPVVNVGHSDLLQLANGEWWLVLLASRPYGGYYRNLGRETFLCPVVWEDGWPLPSPYTGKLELEYDLPGLAPAPVLPRPACEHFEAPEPALEWVQLRTPDPAALTLAERPGWLGLRLRAPAITDKSNPSCLLRRQTGKSFVASCKVEFQPHGADTAGLVLLQNEAWSLRLELYRQGASLAVRAISRQAGVDTLLGSRDIGAPGAVWLMVVAREQDFCFHVATSPDAWQTVARNVDGRILSTDKAGGFVGTCLGMFASANGSAAAPLTTAWFDWFEYRDLD